MPARAEESLRIGVAAAYLGVCPKTLRNWEQEGRIFPERINARGDRRYARRDLDKLRGQRRAKGRERVGVYIRVSSSNGQESSLATQEAELRAACPDAEVRVFRDRASGLNERRRGLKSLLLAASRGELDAVCVTHKDRLTRFGYALVEQLLLAYGTSLRALHADAEATAEQELLDDFMSLLASFSGRVYGQRSAEARKRLIREVS